MFVANDKDHWKKNRCILSEVVIGISLPVGKVKVMYSIRGKGFEWEKTAYCIAH